jgi:hypothetical protein
MTTKRVWLNISPNSTGHSERDRMLEIVRSFSKVPNYDDLLARLAAVGQLRREYAPSKPTPARLRAFCLVLADLVDQGWSCRVRGDEVQIARPIDEEPDRDRIRLQLHVQRDRYLERPPVREFIRSMERRRLFRGKWISIFSLMRDGSELSSKLGEAVTTGNASALSSAIRPYVQTVEPSKCCEHTGLDLAEIWRYFRLTWANKYQSVPGRSLMLLVRDAASPLHPVIGIAALGSSAVQISIRDEWIGWTPDTCVADLRENATNEDVDWLSALVETSLNELYLDDLFDRSVSPLRRADIHKPSSEALAWLRHHAETEKGKHFRLVDPGNDHKRVREETPSGDRWRVQAETPLYKSKRAGLLAVLLRAKMALVDHRGPISGEELKIRLANPESRQAVQSLIRRVKAERVGVAVADITICGAVAPYSHLLGGKLVAMLAASPEAVDSYRQRYKDAESVIASSLAGRPIVRRPDLVFVGTTSLYGAEPNQYTRVQVPCEELGGRAGDAIKYTLLGETKGFGTFQFSDETVDAMQQALSQSRRGQRVNSIFGEGTSPRMRKIREGLDLLNLPSDLLLLHGAPRLVYGVSLVRNLKRYLLAQDSSPDYLFPLESPAEATFRISAYWTKRWLAKRVQNPSILEAVASHRLTYPIRHGARVPIVEDTLPFDGYLEIED